LLIIRWGLLSIIFRCFVFFFPDDIHPFLFPHPHSGKFSPSTDWLGAVQAGVSDVDICSCRFPFLQPETSPSERRFIRSAERLFPREERPSLCMPALLAFEIHRRNFPVIPCGFCRGDFSAKPVEPPLPISFESPLSPFSSLLKVDTQSSTGSASSNFALYLFPP